MQYSTGYKLGLFTTLLFQILIQERLVRSRFALRIQHLLLLPVRIVAMLLFYVIVTAFRSQHRMLVLVCRRLTRQILAGLLVEKDNQNGSSLRWDVPEHYSLILIPLIQTMIMIGHFGIL